MRYGAYVYNFDSISYGIVLHQILRDRAFLIHLPCDTSKRGGHNASTCCFSFPPTGFCAPSKFVLESKC